MKTKAVVVSGVSLNEFKPEGFLEAVRAIGCGFVTIHLLLKGDPNVISRCYGTPETPAPIDSAFALVESTTDTVLMTGSIDNLRKLIKILYPGVRAENITPADYEGSLYFKSPLHTKADDPDQAPHGLSYKLAPVDNLELIFRQAV